MSAAMQIGGWTEEDRERTVAAFADTIDRLAGKILELRPDAALPGVVHYATGLFSAAVRKALRDAGDRVRAARGLPPRPETHREAAADMAEDLLVLHSGGDIDEDSLPDLLVDLVHYAGPQDFDGALEAALERYEAEVQEDAEADGDAEAGEAATPPDAPPVTAEEKRAQQARIARLEAYQPMGYDA